MFCRYCGANIADDSVFCAKCGRRLVTAARRYPGLDRVVSTFRLKTPYPYFIILVALFIGWTLRPRQDPVDFSQLKLSLELDKKLDLPEENTFKQALSLVVENTGSSPIQDIPVEISAKLEPVKQAEVMATFLGRQLMIMQAGKQLPLVVVLGDAVQPGAKRRYLLEGSVQADPPFKITYEVREEDTDLVLASYSLEP